MIRWRWLVLCRLRRCSGETRCRTGRVSLGKRVGHASDTRIRGEIFTDYYFGEANTADKSDNLHNNAINKKFNWGGFPGCYSSLPPTEDLVPRSRTIRGGREKEREARDDEELNTTNKELDSMLTTNFCRDKFLQRDEIVENTKLSVSRGGT